MIKRPASKDSLESWMKEQLFAELGEAGGLTMAIRPPKGVQFYDRKLRR